MRYFKSSLTFSIWSLLLIILMLHVGCGSNNSSNTIIPSLVSNENLIIDSEDKVLADQDDVYYMQLEKKLNEELNIDRAPDKCAAQGLTKIVLNFTTDEIQTCSTYDLSKISVIACFSDKTDEVITPAWSIYSGGGTLDGTIYTATNKPAIIVFKALYSENGISKLALFRLTVTGLISISLNKTTDEIQLPATYDLSTELIITAKLSNGTTKVIGKDDPNLKWVLASGVGTLVDGVYTPSAKVETTTFTANYTENGVTKAAQFKLKVTGLSSLILNKTTDEVNSCETYDLASKIIVSNKLSNGSINDITSSQNLNWALSSGSGTLDGKVYTAPAKAETAVFSASYTEAGITKTAQFRLKVTGLSSVVLDKTTDEIMLPATYDLALEVNATAKFSDGDSKSVDLIWALSSGSGNLSGSLYTPAAKTETAVFIGSYTESGITKTAQFRLKVIGLSSLTLSKTTDEVVSCATYDLSQIIVSDKLSNGTINNITNNTTWKLVSGFGTLSGTIYTAPARAETAAFTANYTEAGIIKTAQFRLKVIALASIKLSKATDEAQILAPYDLASNIAVTAKLSNGQTKLISGNDPNLKWTLSYGSGILSGTVYTPPERIETAVLTATYTENGVAQSAQLRLKSSATLRGKIELVGLTLEQTTDSVRIGQTYDLSKLIAIAKFADKTTAEVSLSWIVSSGGGSISGTTYTAPNNIATVKLMGTFTAPDGFAKSVYFTLTIYGNEIYGNRGTVTIDGAKFYLTNGITVEIPPNSLNETTLVDFALNNSDGIVEPMPGLNFLTCTSSGALYKLIISLPIESGMTKNSVSLTCLMPHIDEIIQPVPIIDDTVCVYIIDSDLIESVTTNTNQASPSKAISNNTSALRSSTSLDPKLAGKEVVHGKTSFRYYLNNTTTRNDIKTVIDKLDSRSFNWPYYRQYWQTCYAATWLMLMKGHQYPMDEKFDSIYKIVSTILLREKNLKFNKLFGLIFKDAKKNIYKYLNQTGLQAVPNLTQEFTGLKNVKAYACDSKVALINLIPVILSNDKPKPLKIDSTAHSVLICGYNITASSLQLDSVGEYNYAAMRFTINDPDPSSAKPLQEVSGNELFAILNPKPTFFLCFTCFCVDQPDSDNAQTLQTIHLPETGAFQVYPGNILMMDAKGIPISSSPILSSQWNPDAYTNDPAASEIEWKKETGQASLFDHFRFNSIPIFNTDDLPKTVLLGALIYKTGAKTTILADAVLKRIINNGFEEQFEIKKADWDSSKNYFDFYSKELVENFKNKLKDLKITTEQDYTLLIKLIDVDTNTTLDHFDVRFKYTPPKELTISTAPKHEFVGNNIQYAVKYGDDNVTSSAVWKVMNPDDNVITDGQGVFAGGLLKTTGEILAIKEYNILASYTDPNSHATSTQEVKLKLLPGIIPSKKTFISNVAQSFQLALATEIMGDRSTSISWSINGAPSTDIYSFLAHENRKDQITARLVKGTMLQTGETLETDLYARATMQVYNMYLEPQTKMIDINEKCPFDLKWDAGQNNTVYFTNQAEWSCSNGTIEITNNRAVYTPSKPGVCVVTAKLAEGTFIPGNSNDVISGNGLEFTAEVTVVKIKFAPDALSARSVPIDAMGKEISGFGTSMNFSVLVDGADVKIEDPFVLEGQAKGVLKFLSKSGDKDNLPVYYNFNFDPAVSTQHYYTDNDPIHIKINCIDCVSSSTAGVFLIYRPVKSDVIDTYYPDGRHYQRYSCVQYTTGENSLIHYHGYYYSWYDNAANSLSYDGQFRHGQGIGQHTTYTEFGKISSQWTIQDDYLGAIWYGYAYSEYFPYTLISVSQYRLTRSSIYEGWTWTYIP